MYLFLIELIGKWKRQWKMKQKRQKRLDRMALIDATPSSNSILHFCAQSSFACLQGSFQKAREEFPRGRLHKYNSDRKTRSHRPPNSDEEPTRDVYEVEPPVQKRPKNRRNNNNNNNNNKPLLSLKEMNACILSSENMRIQCSIMIALLVVVSYISVPHGMTKSNSVFASRPLYIIMLTDVIIVVARLLIMGKQQHEEEAEMKDNEEYNWKGAFALLEIGLVLYQIVRALFIECSFYLVLVLGALSLL